MRDGNHKKWGVAGGLSAREFDFLGRVPLDTWIELVLLFAVVWAANCANFEPFWTLSGHRGGGGCDIYWSHRAAKRCIRKSDPASRGVCLLFSFIWPFAIGFGAVLSQKWLLGGTKLQTFGRASRSLILACRAPTSELHNETWDRQGHPWGSKPVALGLWQAATTK